MDDSNQDYNSFEQYNYNHDVYEKIKIDIWNEYYSFPGDILRGYTEYKDSITRDCSRLRKYLTYFGSEKDCKNKNCCQYINYFLNQRIHKDYHSNQSIFDIYNKYMNHENNNMIKNLCLTEINYMNQEIYNKIDKLYNAYYICNFYISNKNDGRSCNRAKICANAYNSIMTKYTKPDDTKFCKILKALKDYLEQNEPLSTGDCNSRFSALLSYPSECNELLHKGEKRNEPVDQRNGRLDEQEKLQKEVRGEAPEEQRQKPPGIMSPGVESPGVEVSEYGTDMEASATLSHAQLVVVDNNEDPPNDNTPIPAKTIIYTSLGSVLPLVTLYRLTPLGSWVNTKILGKNKLMDNMKKNHYELLLNDVRNGEMSLNDTTYSISYNSAAK